MKRQLLLGILLVLISQLPAQSIELGIFGTRSLSDINLSNNTNIPLEWNTGIKGTLLINEWSDFQLGIGYSQMISQQRIGCEGDIGVYGSYSRATERGISFQGLYRVKPFKIWRFRPYLGVGITNRLYLCGISDIQVAYIYIPDPYFGNGPERGPQSSTNYFSPTGVVGMRVSISKKIHLEGEVRFNQFLGRDTYFPNNVSWDGGLSINYAL